MSRHKKTREQKIAADLHRQKFVYTMENKNLTNVLPANTHTITTTITKLPYSYIKLDILKTFLLTASIIGFQIILFFLLKNHIIVLPMVSY